MISGFKKPDLLDLNQLEKFFLAQIDFAHFFEQAFACSRFFLFAHYTWLFIMLAFFHFRKNAGFFHLLFKTSQGNIKIVIIIVKKNSGQKNHPLQRDCPLKGELSLYGGYKKKAIDKQAMTNHQKMRTRCLRAR